jgi:hypothetical protein
MSQAAAANDPMATGWRAVLAEMLAGAREAALRFPVTALALLLLALHANISIAAQSWLGERNDDMFVGLFAAACASLAASLFGESRRANDAVRHAGALLAATAAFALAWWSGIFATATFALAAALAGLVLVAPYLGRGTGATFWLFGVRFAFAVLLAGLALLLFAGGISAILASLTYLFGLEVPDRAYEHVWAATGLLAAPLFGLGQIPREFNAVPDAQAADFMERGMRALGDFVAAPLLLIYAAILHAYALKIAIVGELPQGQIGWLVLAFGVCVIGALVVIHPFLSAARAPTRLFLRLWPFLLPVPLVLLLYAAALRIGEYGVTTDRYFLVLFGVVALLIVALQIPRATRGDVRIMAALPVFALLIGSFGPHGALGFSLRSQQERFEALVADQPLTGERHDQALSALRFLLWNGAVARVAPDSVALTAADGSAKADHALFEEIAAAYGLDPRLETQPDGQFSRSFETGEAVAVDGFDVLIPMVHLHPAEGGRATIALPSGEALTVALDRGALTVQSGETVRRFPLSAEMVRRLAQTDQAGPQALRLETEGRVLALAPSHYYGTLEPQPEITSITGAILLRSSDW